MDKILPYLKFYAALIGSVITAVLGTVPPDTTLFQTLTVVAAILTAIVTFAVPNLPNINAYAADEFGDEGVENSHGEDPLPGLY